MRAVLIAGAPIGDHTLIKQYIKQDDYIACADSGLSHAYLMGLLVDLAVGDFDSFDGEVVATEVVTLPCRKDDTDCMSLARLLVQRGFDEVLMIGCTGARLDHTMGALAVMLYLHRHIDRVTMLDSKHSVYMVSDGSITICPPDGSYLSVLPFACDEAEGVSIEGAEYPLDNAVITADFPIGVSNRAASNEVKISVKKGVLLVICAND